MILTTLSLDKDLSTMELGLMLYMLSRSDNFTIKKENVINEFVKRGDTKTGLLIAWKHLIKLGYLDFKRVGKPLGVMWIVNEIPHLNSVEFKGVIIGGDTTT